MLRLLIIQLSFLVVGSLLIFSVVGNWYAVFSYSAGAFLVLFNLVILAWGVQRLLQQKLVALSSLIIVSKYAILAVILYNLLKTSWMQPLWFCVGVASLMLAALGTAFLKSEGETAWPSH